ncbi:hypothetical protein Dimus_013641 [Dionaea muscipula]
MCVEVIYSSFVKFYDQVPHVIQLWSGQAIDGDYLVNCPYPSVSEEMKWLGLKCEAGSASPVLRSKSSHGKERKRKKRKPSNLSDSTSSLAQLHSGKKIGQKYLSNSSDDNVMDQNDFEETHLLLGYDSIIMFITTWKEAYREHSAAKVFEKMLDFYDAPSEKKNGLKSVFSTYPFLGLLNVAVTSEFGIACMILFSPLVMEKQKYLLM